MNFTEWLRKQAERADPVGDLARDAALDPGWPEEGSREDLERHLMLTDDHAILAEAWREFLGAARATSPGGRVRDEDER